MRSRFRVFTFLLLLIPALTQAFYIPINEGLYAFSLWQMLRPKLFGLKMFESAVSDLQVCLNPEEPSFSQRLKTYVFPGYAKALEYRARRSAKKSCLIAAIKGTMAGYVIYTDWTVGVNGVFKALAPWDSVGSPKKLMDSAKKGVKAIKSAGEGVKRIGWK